MCTHWLFQKLIVQLIYVLLLVISIILYCIDLSSCIAASVFLINLLTYLLIYLHYLLLRFRDGREVGYCDKYVSLLVYLSVRSHNSKTPRPIFTKVLYTCCLWPWLDLPLASLRYVMYFRCCVRRCVLIAWGQDQARRYISMKFARRQRQFTSEN